MKKSKIALRAASPTAVIRAVPAWQNAQAPGSGRPDSATHGGVIAAGFGVLLLSLYAVKYWLTFSDPVSQTIFVLTTTCLSLLALDLIVLKTHLRPSTGLDFTRSRPSLPRSLTKLIGVAVSLVYVAFLYWLFPEYEGDFYGTYFTLVKRLLPVLAGLAPLYLYFVDKHQIAQHDSYYQLGKLALGNRKDLDTQELKQHFLGWTVKAFFLPLMATYCIRDIATFTRFDFSSLTSFKAFYDFSYNFIFTIDVSVVTFGYLVSLRLTDTHIRSAEPTLMGWVVALLCYEPFWSFFSRNYIAFDSTYSWGAWLSESPILYALWGSAILALFSVYVWASLMFGCRFSNLTHRGILTNGPYAFTKHPAYLSKCLGWWLINVPFLWHDGVASSFRRSAMLLLLNLVYFLRARTEERHLSLDPDYVAYSQWIQSHGLFATLKRLGSGGRPHAATPR